MQVLLIGIADDVAAFKENLRLGVKRVRQRFAADQRGQNREFLHPFNSHPVRIRLRKITQCLNNPVRRLIGRPRRQLIGFHFAETLFFRCDLRILAGLQHHVTRVIADVERYHQGHRGKGVELGDLLLEVHRQLVRSGGFLLQDHGPYNVLLEIKARRDLDFTGDSFQGDLLLLFYLAALDVDLAAVPRRDREIKPVLGSRGDLISQIDIGAQQVFIDRDVADRLGGLLGPAPRNRELGVRGRNTVQIVHRLCPFTLRLHDQIILRRAVTVQPDVFKQQLVIDLHT